MAKDLNNASAVTEQDLKETDAVNQSGVTDQVADGQIQDETLADGTSAEKDVPYSKLKEATDAKNAEAEARKVAEEQAAYAQRQLDLIQQQALVNANAPQRPKSSMEQALIDCGVTADELYGENYVKVVNRKDEIDALRLRQQSANYSTQQFIVSHPDINQVIGSVNPVTGGIMQMSPELMALLSKKPHYAGATLQIAYDAVIQERALAKATKAQASVSEHQKRQGVDNATLPLGGSAAGGSGAGDQQEQKLMTAEQVADIQRKIDSGEIT